MPERTPEQSTPVSCQDQSEIVRLRQSGRKWPDRPSVLGLQLSPLSQGDKAILLEYFMSDKMAL